jgi:macrolide-specific efflux system membrane fusion protein
VESTTVAVLRRHPTAWVNVLLVVLIVGAAGGVFVLLNNDASANTTARTATAVIGEVSSTVSASGTVDAATTKNLTFPAAGRITNVAVAVGDQVTAGQLLAQVDPTAADAAVATAKAAVATAQSSLDQATFDRDQADTAYDDAVAAFADDSTTVQQARLTREAKRAALDAAQAALTKAQADVFDASVARLGTDLHAPVAGTVTTVNNVVGDQSGTDPVIVLATLDQLVVSVSFSEVDAGKLQVGQVAQVTFPALTNVSASGKVAAVATTATTTDGVVSYAVTISLDSVPAGVRAGMSADVDVTTASVSGAVVVPNQAITTTGRASTVTVVKDGTNTITSIQVGLKGDSTSSVTSGLSAGDVVALPVVTTSTTTNGAGRFPGAGGLVGGGGAGRGAGGGLGAGGLGR